MKKSQLIILAVIVVLALAALVVGLIVRRQQTALETPGAVTLKYRGQEITVPLSNLDREEFSGETVNGKGERFRNSYRGIELKTLLQENGISPDGITGVTATAEDQFTAEYTGEELREDQKLFLAVQVNGKAAEGTEEGRPAAQVIVFGDENSHRLVRGLKTLDIQ